MDIKHYLGIKDDMDFVKQVLGLIDNSDLRLWSHKFERNHCVKCGFGRDVDKCSCPDEANEVLNWTFLKKLFREVDPPAPLCNEIWKIQCPVSREAEDIAKLGHPHIPRGPIRRGMWRWWTVDAGMREHLLVICQTLGGKS